MADISWKDTYSVGVEEIDDEHKELISLINMAEAAVCSQDDKEAVAKIASDMAFYALTHFSNEEVLMVSNDYPGYQEHREKHREFSAKAKEIEDFIEASDDYCGSHELFRYLSEWLVDHIMIEDKKLGVFLNESDVD